MRRFVSTGLVIMLLIGAWQALIIGLSIPAYLAPTPKAVAIAAIENARVLLGQTALTLGAAGLGLLISTAFATLFALLFTVSRKAAQTAMPLLLVFRSAPVAAVAPLITLFVGRGLGTGVVVVTIVSFFPLMINLVRGLASADRAALELMHVYGAGTVKQIRHVRIPFALPYFFTGLRIAGASAILGAILSEWITGARGLGKLILDSGEMRETELLWAAVLTSVLCALSVFAATSWAEQRTLRWKHSGLSVS